jgi:hypothetical protein
MVKQKLRNVFNAFAHRNHHLVKLAKSNLESHAPGIFLADHLPSSGLVENMKREIAHIHSGNDQSLHVVLAPADCMFLNFVGLFAFVLTFKSRQKGHRGRLGPAARFLWHVGNDVSFTRHTA